MPRAMLDWSAAREAESDASGFLNGSIHAKASPVVRYIRRRLSRAGFWIDTADVKVSAQIDHTHRGAETSVPRVRIDLKGRGESRVVASWTPADGELGEFVERVASAMKRLQERP